MSDRSLADFSAPQPDRGNEALAEKSAIGGVMDLFGVDHSLSGYQPLETLGRGGMGTVVKAFELATGRLVALKIVPRAASRVDLTAQGKGLSERFEVEVRATARLEHPNIVPIFSVGHGEGFSYYTMRLINGISVTRLLAELSGRFEEGTSESLSLDQVNQTIDSICQRKRPSTRGKDDADSTLKNCDAGRFESTGRIEHNEEEYPTRVDEGSETPISLESDDEQVALESARFDRRPCEMSVYQSFAERIAEIADALQYASDEGVVHRDVKPGNILVDGDGRFYLADFGLAKIHDPSSDQSTACVGTPGYIAPERLRGQSATDPRSDIFALGLVLEQLVTLSTESPLRQPLFGDSHRSSVLGSVPRPLRRIVRAATADDLNDRYANAREFAEDLRRFARGERVLAGASDRKAAVLAQLRQPLIWRSFVASCVVAVVIALALVAHSHLRVRDDLAQSESINQKAVTLYLNMVDDLYLQGSKDSLQSSLAGPRSSRSASSGAVGARKREQLLTGIDYLDDLARTQSDNPATIRRIAQAKGRVGFILQAGGYHGDASRLYDNAESLLVGLNDGPRAAVELCWITYHRANGQHRQFGYASAEGGYQRTAELATPYLAEESIDKEVEARFHEIVGVTRLAQQRYRDAVEHLEAAKGGDLANESRLLGLATAYRKLQRYDDALAIVATCTAKYPENAFWWRNLAAIQMSLNEVEDAAENYETCLSIDPNNELAWQGLAWARFRQGDVERAIELVNQAIELGSANEVILSTRAVFLAAEDRLAEATEDLVKAYGYRPGSDYVARKLFPALLFFPDPDVALANRLLVESRRSLHPASYQYYQALVDYSMGNFDRAAVAFRSLPPAPTDAPPNPHAVTFAWLCEAKSDRTDLLRYTEALAALEAQRRDGWPAFSPSPFDQAIVRHIESFLDETMGVSPSEE